MKNPAQNVNDKHPTLVKQHLASDEVHRIVPLGLTLGEARAWYRNHVLVPQLRRAMASFAAGLMIVFSTVSLLGELLDNTLIGHLIVQHSLLIVAGFILAYAAGLLIGVTSVFCTQVARISAITRMSNWDSNKSSVGMFVAAALLIAFSSLPTQMTAAASNANAHLELHATLLLAGGLIFVGARFLSMRVKLLLPVIAGKAVGLYGMVLLLTPVAVYPVYPVYEQACAGVTFLVLMLVLDFTVMPLWLYNYFNGTKAGNRATLGEQF